MARDPLLTTLLDLDAALGKRELIIGGGYGLFLKQLHLKANPGIRTLFTPDAFPTARTTEDIDLILRAEIVTDSASMKEIREALDALGFKVVDTAKYTQFTRGMEPGQVKIDLLAAPLGEFADRVPKDSRRVKPRPSVKLHASKLEEAVAIDRDPSWLTVSGTLSTGQVHETEVLIPQAFTYVLTKLCAFRDRKGDADKDLGRHHALDFYRISVRTHPQLIDDSRIRKQQGSTIQGSNTEKNFGASNLSATGLLWSMFRYHPQLGCT